MGKKKIQFFDSTIGRAVGGGGVCRVLLWSQSLTTARFHLARNLAVHPPHLGTSTADALTSAVLYRLELNLGRCWVGQIFQTRVLGPTCHGPTLKFVCCHSHAVPIHHTPKPPNSSFRSTPHSHGLAPPLHLHRIHGRRRGGLPQPCPILAAAAGPGPSLP